MLVPSQADLDTSAFSQKITDPDFDRYKRDKDISYISTSFNNKNQIYCWEIYSVGDSFTWRWDLEPNTNTDGSSVRSISNPRVKKLNQRRKNILSKKSFDILTMKWLQDFLSFNFEKKNLSLHRDFPAIRNCAGELLPTRCTFFGKSRIF